MNKKTDLKVAIILTLLCLVVVFWCVDFNHYFGATKDWLTQHAVFPDYFRSLFYKTGNLIPNLALNLGAGQNIYNFSYYGFLNPLILISYILPFIKMIDYFIVLNIVIVIASSFLLYKWLVQNGLRKSVSLVTSILFLFVGPLLFQAHRQVMFVSYMPFLIMGLMGIDRYFKNRRKALYIISVFLMIMTSYYYSVGGLLALFIYGIYKYIKLNEYFHFKKFIIEMLHFIVPMLIGILMAFILLIPTMMAMLSSRTGLVSNASLGDLLIPNFNPDFIFYDVYNLGFTSIACISLLAALIDYRKERTFLSLTIIFMVVMPFIVYLLNGMLYFRGKVLIPLVPLICLLIGYLIRDIRNKNINLRALSIVTIIFTAFCYSIGYKEWTFYLDIALTLILLLICYKRKIGLWYAVLILIAFVACLSNNQTEEYVSKDVYNQAYNKDQLKLIDDTIKKDQGLYRFNNLADDSLTTVNSIYNPHYYQTSFYSSIYNPDYFNFYHDYFGNARAYRNYFVTEQSNNIMFQTLMGVKYLIANKNNVPIGYTYVKGNGEVGLYKNDNVLSLGYASSSLYSENDFNKLEYPYNQEILLDGIIIKDKSVAKYDSHIKPLTLSYDYEADYDITIKHENDTYIIDTSKDNVIKSEVNESISDKIIFIDFILNKAPSCKDGDIGITINNITNKLTCRSWVYFNNNYHFRYTLSSPRPIKEIEILLSKGHYEISDIKAYALDYQYVKDEVKKIDQLIINQTQVKANEIVGHIKVTKDGYMATTIPYDKGFKVYVNNKEVKYEKVNKAFIGFPIKAGTHEIKLIYQAPGFTIGVMGSILGCSLLGLTIIKDSRKKVKE